MSFRSFVRGDSSVDVATVEETLRENSDSVTGDVDLTTLDGENWLSVPLLLDEEYLIKVVTPQNALTHSLFTTARNLGVRLSGTGPLFETYDSAHEMATHEFEATERMREAGVRAPRPVEVVEAGEDALLLLEYLDGFTPLSEYDLEDGTVRDVFCMLRKLHDSRLAHGDFSLENVLVVDGEVYFIDSTNVRDEGYEDAVAYDLGCALGAFATRIPVERVVGIASEFYGAEELEHAVDFLVVARLRPGIEESFSVRGIREAVAGLER